MRTDDFIYLYLRQNHDDTTGTTILFEQSWPS